MHNCAVCGKWLKTIENRNSVTRWLTRIPEELVTKFKCLPERPYFEVLCEEHNVSRYPDVVLHQRSHADTPWECYEAAHHVFDLRGRKYVTFFQRSMVVCVSYEDCEIQHFKTLPSPQEAWKYFCKLNLAISTSRGLTPQEN